MTIWRLNYLLLRIKRVGTKGALAMETCFSLAADVSARIHLVLFSCDEKNFQIFSSVFVFYLFTRIHWHSRGKCIRSFLILRKFKFYQLFHLSWATSFFPLSLFVFVACTMKAFNDSQAYFPIIIFTWSNVNFIFYFK